MNSQSSILALIRKRPTGELLWDFYMLTVELRRYTPIPRRGNSEWPVYEAQRMKLEAVTKVLEERTTEKRNYSPRITS